MTLATAPRNRTRTDVHRPSAMNPADYVNVGYADLGEDGFSYTDTKTIQEIQGGDVVDFRYAETGHEYRESRCDHCGQTRLRYIEVFIHVPTGDLVQVGSTCAGKLSLNSRSEMKARAAARRLATVRGRFLRGNPRGRLAVEMAVGELVKQHENYDLSADLDRKYGENDETVVGAYRREWKERRQFVNRFLADVGQRFLHNGYLSDKQVEAVIKAGLQDRERAAQRAAEQAAQPEAQPIPDEVLEGRAVIEGMVLTVKWQDSDYGGAMKMLVLDDRGFKVWGTVPQAFLDENQPGSRVRHPDGREEVLTGEALWYRPKDAELIAEVPPAFGKGSKVRFDAAVKGSPDDPTFGFFKRPTKTAIIEPSTPEEKPEAPAEPVADRFTIVEKDGEKWIEDSTGAEESFKSVPQGSAGTIVKALNTAAREGRI